MERNTAIYDYWQCANIQQLLHNILPEHVQKSCSVISRSECTNGKLADNNLIESSLMASGSVVIVPFYATQGDKYFFPCLLLVEVNPVGRFIAKKHLSLPIIPRTILEPSIHTPFVLGTIENFDNYMVVQPPEWLDDDKQVAWADQLNYAQEVLDTVTPTWRNDLINVGYTWQDNALVFPLSALNGCNVKTNLDLLDKVGKVNIIDAERNSGKSTYAKQLILNAWIEAGVKQNDPPKHVILHPNAAINYASIFTAVNESKQEFYDSNGIHGKLVELYNTYMQGQHYLRNWQEAKKRIKEKYADKGGVQVRLDQLRKAAHDVKANKRHIQVLHSIWLRQLELLTDWAKIFDFIPIVQSIRLRRLYSFFKQNFPNENVKGFKQKQLECTMQEKLARAETSERITCDTLYQVENDVYQEQLMQDKCLQWCQTNGIQANEISEIQILLHDTLWHELVDTALIYWQQDFAAKQGYANFLDKQPNEIDLLIIEHAEYISPILAARFLAISKRALVMGNYSNICNPRFPVQIDYELTKHFGLAECDADFEDLQFDGITASVGNAWNLIVQSKEADQVFQAFQRPALQYEYIDVQSVSEIELGSRVNHGVIEKVIDWLNRHITLCDEVTIYTCFSSQVRALRLALGATPFANVPIRLIQEPYFNQSAISLFLPVYTRDDQGPYVFDRGTEILDQLISNTLERLIVIGDMGIFKPELHSAAGKFARALFYKSGIDITNIIKEQEEVICV